MAESEWGQAMDSWLNLLRDFEELAKEKKAKAAGEKGQKKTAVMLRERMNQTIRERRAAEREGSSTGDTSPIPGSPQPSGSSQSTPITTKDRRLGNHMVEGDKAFASQRRTVDRILDSLTAGDEAMVMQIKEVEGDKMDRWETVEREKLDVLREALGARKVTEGSSVDVARLAARVETLEAQGGELREVVREQGKEMQRAIAEQGQRTEEKLDTLMAILRQPR